jgi:hypothetical protein
MSTEGQPLPQQPAQPDPAEQTRELLRFLRLENEANRTAVRQDAESNRNLFLSTLKVVSWPVAVALAVAGFFGWKSFADMTRTMQSEARLDTRLEIDRMRGEIRKSLNEQFQTAALQQMVRQEAREATSNAATPLIKGEVATQVKIRVDAERGTIAKAVTAQTQLAVAEMTPHIDSQVKQSVDAKVDGAVQPVIQQLDSLKGDIELQLTIARMNADDAEAFDSLVALHAFRDSAQQRAVTEAVRSVAMAHNGGMYQTRSFKSVLTEEQLMVALIASESTTRQAALDTLVSTAKPSMLPRIVEVIQSDPSIDVRCSAYRLFNKVTQQAFVCLDKASLMTWWEVNNSNFIK